MICFLRKRIVLTFYSADCGRLNRAARGSVPNGAFRSKNNFVCSWTIPQPSHRFILPEHNKAAKANARFHWKKAVSTVLKTTSGDTYCMVCGNSVPAPPFAVPHHMNELMLIISLLHSALWLWDNNNRLEFAYPGCILAHRKIDMCHPTRTHILNT